MTKEDIKLTYSEVCVCLSKIIRKYTEKENITAEEMTALAAIMSALPNFVANWPSTR